ncbi:MAG: HAMP domain-containing protein, partial [Planctomycetota bacterium]
MSLTVLLLVGGMCSLLLGIQQRSLSSVSDQVAQMVQQVETQQASALEEVQQQQIAAAQRALQTKARSLASVLAKLSPVALLTLDTETLDTYCREIAADPDVVFACVFDSEGTVQSTFRNESDATLQQLLGGRVGDSAADVFTALKGKSGVFEVAADIEEEGQHLGRAVVLIRDSASASQSNSFAEFAASSEKLMGTLVDDVKQQAHTATVRGTWVGVLAGLIGLAATMIAVLLVLRSITRPLKRVAEGLKDIAQGEGDLTRRLPMRKVNCSAQKKCNRPQCPEYGKEASCWDTVGSNAAGQVHCPSILSGKYASCHECPVMQDAVRDEIDEIAAWFNTFLG